MKLSCLCQLCTIFWMKAQLEEMQPEHSRIDTPHVLSPWITWAIFALGLVAALSLRLILVAKAYRPELIRALWYMGICGNMIFFFFRSYITYRRRRLITELDLIAKLEQGSPLTRDECNALRYLVKSLYASKERWNYAVISIFSFAAIAWDLFWTH